MQGWEEIVYENRNKDYGSYLLRKKFNKYLLIGLLCSLGLTIILFVFIYLDINKTEEISPMPLSLSVELNQVPDDNDTPPPPALNPSEQEQETPILVDSVKEESKHVIKKEEGNLADSSLLNADNKASGNGFDLNNDSSFYIYADEMPQYYGGEPELRRFLQKSFNFPKSALKNKKHGKVIVQFIVSKTGDIKDITIQTSVDPELDKEVLRVVSLLPKWKPGRQAGRPVNVMFRIPINLKL